MISLVAIYLIGKVFYDLADTYGRSKWGMAILGVVMFFFGQLALGFVLALTVGMNADDSFVGIDDIVLSIMGIGAGLLMTCILYFALKALWKRSSNTIEYELLDDDLT